MAQDIIEEALTSSETLVKALKGPLPYDAKSQIASAAWARHTLFVPRKADLLLEWALETLLKYGGARTSTAADGARPSVLNT